MEEHHHPNQPQPQPQQPSFHSQEEYRAMEFHNLDAQNNNQTTTTSSSVVRQERLQREYQTQQQFVPYSNALWELREKCRLLHDEIQRYTEQIQTLERQCQPVRPFLLDRQWTLQQKLQSLQQQDPEYVYHTSIQQLRNIRKEQQYLLNLPQQQQQQQQSSSSSYGTPQHIQQQLQRYELVLQSLQTQITSAKSCLPQYNYHGLWIGKYGNSASTTTTGTTTNEYDLINVTYVLGNDNHHDMLIATKVTSYHGHVPTDEITFQVPLYPIPTATTTNTHMPPLSSTTAAATTKTNGTPSSSSSSSLPQNSPPLPPIPLSPNAASKWGISQLSRFYGYGQVAEPQYQNHHWVPGQFIVINANYFSFAWLPSSSNNNNNNNNEPQSQIFFGRPSPELVLKLLAKKNTIPPVETNDRNPMRYDDSNIIHSILPSQFGNHNKKIPEQSPQQPSSTASSSPPPEEYEFPSITAARQSQTIQSQRALASRCLDLTYEQILDDIDVQYHNPYGNGIWHHCLEQNGGSNNDDDDQCYFE